MAKKGGAVNRFLWMDTQAIFDVDPVIRSQNREWLLGPQTYAHEVERTLELIPLPKHLKPTTEDVQTLPLGHFFFCVPEFKLVKQVYVQPWWLPDEVAQKIALGEVSMFVDDEPNPEIMKYKPDGDGRGPTAAKVADGRVAEDWSEVSKAWKEVEELVQH